MERIFEGKLPLMAILLAVLAGFALLAGCSGQQEASSSSQASTSSSTASSAIVVGTQAASSKAVSLENGTGGDITFVSIAPDGSQDEPTVLSIDGGAWKDGQSAVLFYEPDSQASSYNLVVTVGGVLYDLHDVKLAEIDSATVKLDGYIAYLTYEKDGATVSTLDDEKTLAAQAAAGEDAVEDAADGAAADEPAAEPAAEAEPVYEEPVYEEPVYEEPAVTYEAAPEPAAEAAPEQSGDQCVEGGVLLR